MHDVSPELSVVRLSPASAWRTDDAWAIAAGLGLILAGIAFTLGGSGFGWIAVTPPKWTQLPELAVHFAKTWPRYVAQFVLWSVLVGVALRALGYRPGRVLPAFSLIYALSVLIFCAGQWASAVKYNLEPPLLALAAGLILANLRVLPQWFDDGFRVEFYIKLGVVLLGATLPLSLLEPSSTIFVPSGASS